MTNCSLCNEARRKRGARDLQTDVANDLKSIAVAEQVKAASPGDRVIEGECNRVIRKAEDNLSLAETTERTAGGELAVAETGSLVDTLDDPDYVGAAASASRMELAQKADVLVAGADLAETIGAQDSLERMIAHEMALAHKLAMEFGEHASSYRGKADRAVQEKSFQMYGLEATRAANASARQMEMVHKATLALLKLRNGGDQTVKVVHVEVKDNAQAVVANGNVGGGRKRGRM